MKRPTKIADIKINEYTYTHDLWEASPGAVISSIADSIHAAISGEIAPKLPETTEGLYPGAIWNDKGTLRIATEQDEGVITIGGIDWAGDSLSYHVSENTFPLEPQISHSKHAPFPARALRSEPGAAPFLTFEE